MNETTSPWIEILDGDWSAPLKLRIRGRSMWPTLRPGDQVTVEPVAIEDLRPGDWVLLRGQEQEGAFLHRFLGFTREGRLLTKGDGHRAPDPPWHPQALAGRAVACVREGRTIPIATSPRERLRTGFHRLLAAAWLLLRRAGLPLILIALAPVIVQAAVTLVSFEATPQDQAVLVTWETASEVNMFGFYVNRAPYTPQQDQCLLLAGRERVSTRITPTGDIIGASYAYTDTAVTPGQTYYYCLEAVESDGSKGFHGPVVAALPAVPTPTSRPDPPPPPPLPTTTPVTPTTTATANSTTTASPAPTGQPTRAPTATPTRAPTATSTRAPTATSTRAPTATLNATSAATAPATDTPASGSTPQPAETPSPISVAEATSPSSNSLPTPTPSTPTPTPTYRSTGAEALGLPCGLLVALVVVGGVLIALGVWGFWKTRGKT